MCQMKVVIDKNGTTEKLMDEVTRLEVTPEGIVLSTFFENDKVIPGVHVKMIDFMKTTVTLGQK
jgi:predicted RNA-binding protein